MEKKNQVMNYAIIDLGSNTVRLSIYSCENNQIAKIFGSKKIAGLAGYVSNGVLKTEGIHKACVVLNKFKELALKHTDSANIYLFATASLRNIQNREEALRLITEGTSLTPDVLSGDEEAIIGFSGASQFADCANGIMIDIGGASTELVLFKDYKAVNVISLPIGCLNLSIDYVNKIIPTEQERKQIKTAVNNQLSKVDWDKDVKYPLIVGIGGTVRAVLKLSQVVFDLPLEQNKIEACCVKKMAKLLRNNENDIYQTVYKTIPERLFTITQGLIILQQAIKKFGSKTIWASEYGVREGYLVDRVLKKNEKHNINKRERR
jgi:exopolyphosphatase/guanosine-5'-triphosphate,3'-diphosphate pyrophosphatase